MLKISITGNMGSGKTTVCKVFETLGVPIFYADLRAREILNLPDTINAIKQIFGEKVAEDNTINRKALASLVFKDKIKLQQLNQIIHPQVHTMFEQWLRENENHPYCIQEAAIVFETGYYKKFDYNILIYAPLQQLKQRIMLRDNLDPESIEQRLANQMDQQEKKKLSDYTITNDNTRLILPELLYLHDFFLKGMKSIPIGQFNNN